MPGFNNTLPNYRVSIDIANALINAGVDSSFYAREHIITVGRDKCNQIVYSPKQNYLWCVGLEDGIEQSEELLLTLTLIPTHGARLAYLGM